MTREELEVELRQRHDLSTVVLPQGHQVLVPEKSLVRVQRELVHLVEGTEGTQKR